MLNNYPLKKSPQFYFISDIHIGGEGALDHFDAEKELIEFLLFLRRKAKKRTVELIIVGDLFNLWEIQETGGLNKLNYIKKKHSLLVKTFKKASKKISITVIPGNHDHELAGIKKYSLILRRWGINLISNRCLNKKIFNKLIRIEHGNRFDPFNNIKHFGDTNDTPLGFHIANEVIAKSAKIAQKNLKQRQWLANLRLVHPINLIPYWFFSNYFYRELAPILRYLIAPFFILFTASLIVFGMAIATRINLIDVPDIFYYTNYLGPAKYLANFIIILYFVFLIIFLVFSLLWLIVKRDVFKSVLEYGINLKEDVKLSKIHNYQKKVKRFLKNNPQYDLFIYGDSHTASLNKIKIKDKTGIIANTGTWIKLFCPIKSWFRLPSVYFPYFKLSYLVLEQKNEKVVASLKHWPKKATQSLTLLEKFSIIFKNREIKIKDKTLNI